MLKGSAKNQPPQLQSMPYQFILAVFHGGISFIMKLKNLLN